MSYALSFVRGILVTFVASGCAAWLCTNSQSQESQTPAITQQPIHVEPTRMTPGALFPNQPELLADAQLGLSQTIVKGHPFAAQVLITSERHLDDGNSVRREVRSAVYRNSEGWVRYEQGFPTPALDSAPSPESVVIQVSDPVHGIFYTLLPNLKKCFKTAVPANGVLPPELTPGGLSPKDSRPGYKVESLGYQVIEGAPTEGIKITTTTPAGEEGNTLPIEVVSEKWFSSELHVNVLVKFVDPRSGETQYRVTGVKQEEPAASLFVIPPEYRVLQGGTTRTVPTTSQDPKGH